MIPLFKSHYSIGKSILTLSPPTPHGPASISAIAQEHKINPLILVEDSLVGFLEAKKLADELNIQLIFGLRIDMCGDMSVTIKRNSNECTHKVIIFAKNSKGCRLLNKIYSAAGTKGGGKLDFNALKNIYTEEDLFIAIPFYDSFLFHNLLSYKKPCILDHSFFNPTFFVENNLLPFDKVLEEVVEEYAAKEGFITQQTKSIYYENRSDFEAYQTYKCICGRGFSAKAKTLDAPNLDHCGSPEFCLESYLEYESS